MTPTIEQSRPDALTLNRRWNFGVMLAMSRVPGFEQTATPEQVAGVYAEDEPVCCADVNRIAEKWGVDPTPLLNVWLAWN